MTLARLRQRHARRAVTVVQYVLLASLITVAVLSAVRSLGNNAKTNITTTAGNVANPASLPSRFGS